MLIEIITPVPIEPDAIFLTYMDDSMVISDEVRCLGIKDIPDLQVAVP